MRIEVEKVNISELIKRVEDHYKKELSEDGYKNCYEDAEYTLSMVISHKTEGSTEICPVHEAVSHCITPNSTDQFIHMIMLAGLNRERERQRNERNEANWRAMCELVTKHFLTFLIPDAASAKILSKEEFFELLQKQNVSNLKKEIRKTRIELFFMRPFIYYPLSIPFLLITICFVAVLAVKHAIRPAKKYAKEGANGMLDVSSILEGVDKGLPKIMKFDYYYYQIIFGCILWAVIIKMIWF